MASHGPNYRHVIALGSSFAAGPSIEPIVNAAARRSGANYPSLVARAVGAELTDLSVSGATTDNILHTPQRTSLNPLAEAFPPQIRGIPRDADLIFVTAGGNNLGYSLSTIKASFVGWLKSSYLTYPLGYLLGSRSTIPTITQKDLDGAIAGLVSVVEAARSRAPAAKVILVDYLTVFSPSTTSDNARCYLTQSEIDTLRDIGLRLDKVFEEASRSTGATLVRSSELSKEHGVGTTEPWVTGFALYSPVPFHPNALGMQKVADEILRVLGV